MAVQNGSMLKVMADSIAELVNSIDGHQIVQTSTESDAHWIHDMFFIADDVVVYSA